MEDEIIRLQPKQEAFAKAAVLPGISKVKAREMAGYSMAGSSAARSVDADKLYNHPKISLRIAQLQKLADEVCQQSFKCTVESLAREFEEVRVAALEEVQLGAANAAIMGKAKLFGLDRPLDRPQEKPDEKIANIKIEVVGGRA